MSVELHGSNRAKISHQDYGQPKVICNANVSRVYTPCKKNKEAVQSIFGGSDPNNTEAYEIASSPLKTFVLDI